MYITIYIIRDSSLKNLYIHKMFNDANMPILTRELMSMINQLQDQIKWLERATKTFGMTLYQLDASNASHKYYAENLLEYASHVKDKSSYQTFIRYNKDVLLAIKGK